ncbi:MAG: glycosyltransferase family 2 protein [Verrucomicrobiae bacterium]|nr:glycosyltransferase family 2 protein [Verrucomicrobiae bacterium]
MSRALSIPTIQSVGDSMARTPTSHHGTRGREDASGSSSPPPVLTVATVTYNAEKTLEKTILSVLSQTAQHVEYVIVDGGSTDSTLEILQQYSDRISCWITQKDGGVYDAMNKAIALSRGQWIHLLNADDCYVSGESLAQVIPRLDSCRLNCSAILQKSGDRFYGTQIPPRWRWPLYYSAYIPHPGLIVSREQYGQLGLFDTRYAISADHDFILRALARYGIHVLRTPLVLMDMQGKAPRHFGQAFGEFCEITILHGLPRWLAHLIKWFKIFRYRHFIHKKMMPV